MAVVSTTDSATCQAGGLGRSASRISIKNGRTSGQSIGLTSQGYVDLGNDTARLNGIVVPAFALNNLLSNVPLLGPLLTGGKDGGLFAISYQLQGPLDDLSLDGLDWIIFGGESGPGYRAPAGWADWARRVRQRCADNGVAFFFKQSPAPRTEMGILLDGESVRQFPTPRGLDSVPQTVPEFPRSALG